MDFLVVSGLFVLLMVGLVLVFQGIVGKEIYLREGNTFQGISLGRPVIDHPPEKHRVRLVLIGLGLMVVAVVVAIFTI